MIIKKLFNLKNILVPLLLIFGLAGHAGENFAAKYKSPESSKVAKKKATKTKKAPKKTKHKQATKDKKNKKAKTKKTSKDKKTHKKAKQDKEKKTTKTYKSSKAYKHKNAVRDRGADRVVGRREDGRAIYEGPRGGRYYINDSGNKVYLPRE